MDKTVPVQPKPIESLPNEDADTQSRAAAKVQRLALKLAPLTVFMALSNGVLGSRFLLVPKGFRQTVMLLFLILAMTGKGLDACLKGFSRTYSSLEAGRQHQFKSGLLILAWSCAALTNGLRTLGLFRNRRGSRSPFDVDNIDKIWGWNKR
jgi:hypothetical protein